MYYALDRFKKRIYITDSKEKEEYTCPICGEKLIRKMGDIRAFHFAHKKANCDNWYTGRMSWWHKTMQSHFPIETQEVRINSDKDDNVFHIADIFIKNKKGNIIIEFQHSPITSKEFQERNEFYSNNNTQKDEKGNILLNKVIWVFDYREKNIFCTLSDNEEFFLEKAYKNDMCIELIEDENLLRRIKCYKQIKYKENEFTQKSIPLDKAKYAKIIKWKNANKMFQNIPLNIGIYFNLTYRRFIYDKSDFKFLNEYCTNIREKKDIICNFLFHIPDNKMLNNSEEIIGEYIKQDDFFEQYNKLIK